MGFAAASMEFNPSYAAGCLLGWHSASDPCLLLGIPHIEQDPEYPDPHSTARMMIMEKAGGETTLTSEQAFLTSGKLLDLKVKTFHIQGIKNPNPLCTVIFKCTVKS